MRIPASMIFVTPWRSVVPQRWHQEGVSIDHAMLWLCTYLGHAKITDTYWYLTGVPELMDIIGARFERFALQRVCDE